MAITPREPPFCLLSLPYLPGSGVFSQWITPVSDLEPLCFCYSAVEDCGNSRNPQFGLSVNASQLRWPALQVIQRQCRVWVICVSLNLKNIKSKIRCHRPWKHHDASDLPYKLLQLSANSRRCGASATGFGFWMLSEAWCHSFGLFFRTVTHIFATV